MAGKHETGISGTGEEANPLNQKVRRTSAGWKDDPATQIADGRFAQQGVRNSAALRRSGRFRGKGR